MSELFPPDVGGSAVLFDEVYRRLAACEALVLTDGAGDGAHSTPPLVISRGLVRMREWGVLNADGMVNYLRRAMQIRSMASRHRPCIVHCGRALPEGVSALLAKMANGPKYLCWAHGEDIVSARSSRELFFLMRRVLSGAHALIANSHNTRALLEDSGARPERIHVVHPGVDDCRFSASRDPQVVRARYGVQDAFILLSVGRLQRRKGHDHVLAALASLGDLLPSLCYIIVGEGQERRRLEGLVEAFGLGGRVIFAGQVSGDDLPMYYAASDVFVLPNRVDDDGDLEGFGIVFLEAAACGKPVIAGNSGGVSEAVEDGVTGILVGGTDTAELAGAIRQLTLSSELRQRLGQAGRKRVQREFTWERAAAHVERIHLEVAES